MHPGQHDRVTTGRLGHGVLVMAVDEHRPAFEKEIESAPAIVGAKALQVVRTKLIEADQHHE